MVNYLIKDKKTLKQYLEADKKACLGDKKITPEIRYRRNFKYRLYCYLKTLRKLEYMCYLRDTDKNPLTARIKSFRIKGIDRKKNLLSAQTGIDIVQNRAEKGIRIAHPNVILNGYCGEGCVFHGNNVLGNKGTGMSDDVPHLGNFVDVGVGAIIIGKVEIADNCVIGAGAVVTKSFTVPGTVVAGVPAKEL